MIKIAIIIFFFILSTSCSHIFKDNNTNSVNNISVIENQDSDGWNSNVDSSISSNYKDAEYNAIFNNTFEQIKLADAYALLQQNSKNIAGDDIDVAVIDTGINLTHSEFSGDKIRVFDDNINRDYVNNDNDVTDDNSHGSHVSGIIAANRDGGGMNGVAFNARIVGYKSINNNGSGAMSDVANAISQAAIDDVDIINLSLGGSGSNDNIYNALIEAKNEDILILAATGNDSNSQASYPARYASDENLQNYILAVGSVSSDNSISNFSNHCGDVANYCLVAPGESVYAPIDTNNDYALYSGTSMATPLVSGVAAILRSAWPHLTASDTAKILLQTATDLGDAGVDSIYGYGLLNAKDAVNHIGQSYIPATSSINGFGYNLSDSNIVTSSIFGDVFSTKIASQMKEAVFFDDFGRDYKIDFSNKIISQSKKSIIQNLVFSNNNIASLPIVGRDYNFNIKFINQINSQDINNNIIGSNYFNINNFIYDKSITDPHKIDNSKLSFIYQKSFNSNLKLAIANNDYFNYLENRFINDYGLISDKSSFSHITSTNLNLDNISKNSFIISQNLNQDLVGKFSLSLISDDYSVINAGLVSDIMQIGFDYKLSFLNMDFNYGQMSEYGNRILGGNFFGAFSSISDSKTNFITIKNKYEIVDNFYFVSRYFEGLTNLSGNDHGIFRNYSNIKSRGYSFGLFSNNFFGAKLAINYSEPLRVYSGLVDINIPISRDIDGNINRLSLNNINLKPSGKEKNIEISYILSNQNSNFNLNLLAVEEAMNIKESKNEYIIFLKYNKVW